MAAAGKGEKGGRHNPPWTWKRYLLCEVNKAERRGINTAKVIKLADGGVYTVLDADSYFGLIRDKLGWEALDYLQQCIIKELKDEVEYLNKNTERIQGELERIIYGY